MDGEKILKLNNESFRVKEEDVSKLFQSLKPGQTIRGRIVKELDPSKYLFRFNGNNYIAESSIKLKQGENIFARIEDIKNQVVLNLIQEGDFVQKKDFKTLLSKIGIPDFLQNANIIKKMLKYELPISFEDVKEFNKLLTYILNKNAEKINVEININGNTIEQEVDKYMEWLASLVKRDGLANVSKMIERLADVDIGLKQFIENISGLYKNLALYKENGLVKITPETINEILKTVDDISSFFENGKVNIQKIKEFLQKTGAFYEKDILENNIESVKDTLKYKLLSLEKFITDEQINTTEAKDLLNHARNTLKTIEDLQILNKNEKNNISEMILLAMPNLFDKDDSVKLKMFLNNKKNKKDKKDKMDVVFILNMSNLGSLKIDMDYYQKSLGLSFLVENEKVQNLINDESNILKEKLFDLDFQLNSFNVLVKDKNQLDDFDFLKDENKDENKDDNTEELELPFFDIRW